MEILTVYRYVLLNDATVSGLLGGDVHIETVNQSDQRPNILLEMPESGHDYSHQGPVGLRDAHVRVTARADSRQSAGALGKAIEDALKNWTGMQYSHTVQLTELFRSSSGYDDKASVFLSVSEYTSHFTRS